MADTIDIPQINLGNTASANQFVTINYKLYTATSWTLWNNNVQIDPNGFPVAPNPISIGPLPPGTYNVQAIKNCGSPASMWTTTVTLS